MIANEIQLNPDATAYDLYSEFQARQDERAYQILTDVAATVILAHAAGHYSIEVAKAVQIDVLVGHLAIDVARQTEGK